MLINLLHFILLYWELHSLSISMPNSIILSRNLPMNYVPTYHLIFKEIKGNYGACKIKCHLWTCTYPSLLSCAGSAVTTWLSTASRNSLHYVHDSILLNMKIRLNFTNRLFASVIKVSLSYHFTFIHSHVSIPWSSLMSWYCKLEVLCYWKWRAAKLWMSGQYLGTSDCW